MDDFDKISISVSRGCCIIDVGIIIFISWFLVNLIITSEKVPPFVCFVILLVATLKIMKLIHIINNGRRNSMANSIIHVGSQNLGSIYTDTWKSKDTFGMYRGNKNEMNNKNKNDKRSHFYNAVRQVGRKCLERDQREQKGKEIKRNFKNYALHEKTILKILDAYYYCCAGTQTDEEKNKRIESSLHLYLKRMKIDSRVIETVLKNEKNFKLDKGKKLSDSKQKNKNNALFYRKLHTYLLRRISDPNFEDKAFLAECQLRGRQKEYLMILEEAYWHKKKRNKRLKEISNLQRLSIYKKDVNSLERQWHKPKIYE